MRVLKNGRKYYSSFLDGRQYIYSFIKNEPLRNCQRFISDYKRIHSTFPPADTSYINVPTRSENSDYIYVDTEDTEELQRTCLIYNAGLVAIESFEYVSGGDAFDVKISAAEILPYIDHSEQVELLHYALLLDSSDTD